ncbi:MAG: bifunctional ADP-dependent NAD(P)H-hydrate dehydratase/NAD(P)H-hydrate epimerase [Microbacteriaceae bacterium]|jgi:hydroxyethylthiazole kinase-like uncharacterized protein yjeF|nr:bifunctional ADP-dependent NAD(P)H-hydrate dehydratase/NAD(P)H-hydrate epimerase [Microbacteriaceae bacterium]
MIEAYTADDIRRAEGPELAAGRPLMRIAARALAGVIRERLGTPVRGAVLGALIGAGDNGGDALFALAELAREGATVTAVRTSPRIHQAGSAALTQAGGTIVPLTAAQQVDPAALRGLCGADLVLDGMLGIGASGALREPAAAAVRTLRELGLRHVLAVDVPSGIGVDDGSLPGEVLPAELTVTFGGVKAGLLLPPAREICGDLRPIDLSYPLGRAPVRLLQDGDVRRLWAIPGPHDHKYTRGVVGLVTGSGTYPGAAVLGANAAVLSGAGMVRYLGPEGAARAVLTSRPEIVTAPGRVQAWVIGSGLPETEARDRLGAVLDSGLPCVVDAGALAALPAHVGPQVLLTPHAGELSALLTSRGERVSRAEVEAAPAHWARRAQRLTGATVLLKGSCTLVCAPDGILWVAAAAPAWLGTAGAGDVLAGLLGTILAGHAAEIEQDPARVAPLAALGALVHGRAAHRANPGGPVSALGVARALGPTIAGLLRG